jgi:hypothetical protein
MRTFFILFTSAIISACTPEVKVQAPDKPIEINMNVNINHQIKVQLENELDKTMQQNSDIF